MYGRLNRKIGFSLIVFAFFFLFEPSYGLIDPLPDIIGYVILSIALVNLADINDKIMTALKGFFKCIFISAIKISSCIVIDKFLLPEEQPMATLIVTFLIAFFEIIILVPSYKALFEGLLALGIFHNGEEVYKKRRENGRNRTEKVYSLTLAFVVIKTLVCALPDFSTLQNNSAYEFIIITRILAIIFVTPIAIAWLVAIVSYFIRIKKDTSFIDSLTNKYLEQKENCPEIYIFRPVSVALTIAVVGLVLTFDIYSGDINYLPDLFFFAFVILAAIILHNDTRQWKSIVTLSVIGALLSIFLFVLEQEFFTRHFIGAIKRDIEAYNHYYLMLGIYFLQAILTVATIILLSRLFSLVLHKHKGKREGTSVSLEIRQLLFVCLGILSNAATVFHIIALPYFKNGWLYEYSGIISSVISIGFIASAWTLVEYIRSEIKTSYKLNNSN